MGEADRTPWILLATASGKGFSPTGEPVAPTTSEVLWLPAAFHELVEFSDAVADLPHRGLATQHGVCGSRRTPLAQARAVAAASHGFFGPGSRQGPSHPATGMVPLPSTHAPGRPVEPQLHMKRTGRFWWSYRTPSATFDSGILDLSDLVRFLPLCASHPAELAEAFRRYSVTDPVGLADLLADYAAGEPGRSPDARILVAHYPHGLPEAALGVLLEADYRPIRERAVASLGTLQPRARPRS